MNAESEIKTLIQELYSQVGGNPNDIQIIPKDGGWGTALSYEVSKEDGKKQRVFRCHIDDKNDPEINKVLRKLL